MIAFAFDVVRQSRGAVVVAAAALFLLISRADAAEGESTREHLIDLPAALRLAGAQNLDVEIARARFAEARAVEDGATWQFFPWLGVGAAYRAHDGYLQETSGNILDVDRDSFEVGPTLIARVELGDAIYRKLAARQLTQAASLSVEAQQHAVVLAAALNYFDLVKARATVAVAGDSVRISTEYLAACRTWLKGLAKMVVATGGTLE